MFDIKETDCTIKAVRKKDGRNVSRRVWEDAEGKRYVCHQLKDGSAFATPLKEFKSHMLYWRFEFDAE